MAPTGLVPSANVHCLVCVVLLCVHVLSLLDDKPSPSYLLSTLFPSCSALLSLYFT